jgi:hypothetical protein
VVLAALMVRIALGFGFSLVFVPVCSLVLGFSTAFHAAIVLELLIGTLLVVQFRHHLQLLTALSLKAWGFVGIAIGVALRAYVDEAVVLVISMGAITAACLALLAAGEGFELRPSRGRLSLAGISSGFLNSWTSLSGPPVVLYYLLTERNQLEMKGGLTGYFAILYALTFAFLAATGQYAGFDGWSTVFAGALTILVAYPLLRAAAPLQNIDIRRPALWVLAVTAALVAVRQLS